MTSEAKAYEILTKKRYNRDEPYLKDKLRKRVHYFILHNKPIELVGFWGVGLKNKPNWADLASCEFLAKVNNEIKEVYSQGIEFIFIFATLHGIHNGIISESIDSYTKEMEKIFIKFDFKFVYLEPFWKKYGITFEKIDAIFEQKEKDWWNSVENAKTLEEAARKRNTALPAKLAAQKYFIMRDLEKEMLEKEFPNAIFHTFSDSRWRCVLPNMPMLYLYPIRLKKNYKRAEPPWFVIENR